MATYVLVHGAHSGGHIFRRVRRSLQSQGHEVFTPTLTGIGAAVHLVSPQVRIATHVEDLVNLVLFEDLDHIVLLGYSLGGMVITGALEHIGDRVDHLVYLDAFVPGDGDSAASLNGAAAPAFSTGAEWLVQPATSYKEDPVEGPFVAARRVPQPIRTIIDPVSVPRPPESFPFSRTYIKATGDLRPEPGARGAAFWAVADRVRDDPSWQYVEIDDNHLIPVNRPDELTSILVSLVN